MKYSYTWLKELSGTKKAPQELANLLIAKAFEVEEIIEQGKGLEKVVVGEVLTKEKHPDADKLNVATVNVGTEKLTIVCGAPNLAVGQKVPVALIGAELPTEDGKGFTITKSRIRGVESNGMICAEDELGLGDDHEGIMVLASDAPIGDGFAQYYGLDDTILDIDILPNRGHDALGHWGMAREIAALEGRSLDAETKNNIAHTKTDFYVNKSGLQIHIDTDKCVRYEALSFEGVVVAPSPQWMQARLTACDIVPINNIVDVTNYVMLEYGQPTHAFALAQVTGENGEVSIGVRHSQENEKLTLLNDDELQLCKEDIVITAGATPIALAGVMGGQGSAITDDTTDIIFEVANFDASTIRKTKSRYNLDTDAAYRFERDLDQNLIGIVGARIVSLMKEMTDRDVKYMTDMYPHKQERWTVIVPHKSVEYLLGIALENSIVVDILTHLGIEVVQKDDVYMCSIPTLRRDLREVADIIEEIGRIYGYDKITAMALREIVQPAIKNEQRMFERMSKDFFVNQGFDEIKAYSFYSITDAQALGVDDEKHIALLNPMSSEQALMRQTLATGLMRASVKNSSYEEQVQLFEVGRIYAATENGLPVEQVRLAASITTKEQDGTPFFVLKGQIEQYLQNFGISGIYCDDVFGTDDADIIDLHPSRRALIKTADGRIIGFIGEVAKKTAKYFGVKKMRTTLCEINMHIVQKYVHDKSLFAPLAKFPQVARDVSLIVEAQTHVADVERHMYAVGGELLRDIDLFDLYINPKSGERSMAFHCVFAHVERTLTAKEVDTLMAKIIANLENELGINVRQ